MAKGLSQNDPVHPSRFDRASRVEAGPSLNLKSLFNNRIQVAVFALFFFGLFLLAFGAGMFLLKGSGKDDDIRIISSNGGDQSVDKIVVHVDGAVNTPGVYAIDADLRVNDLVSLAGGLSSDADTAQINFAAKLTDGQKIYLPRIGESVRGTGSTTGTGLINVNTASEVQLDTLPGVGPVTAGKIIAGRPYSAPEDLLSKKVVGRSTYEKVKDLITVF